MTNNNNKKMITGIKSKGINIEKHIGDIKNVFIFCLFKKVESSSPRMGYNAITFLSNKFPVITSVTGSLPTIRVVSLFPEYFYKTYGVIDNSNIKVLNLVQFMFIIDSSRSGKLDLNNQLYVFHGFRWSQIIHIYTISGIDIYGVKVTVRHTVNSLLIQLFSYLIPLFGSLEAVGKHLIEGTDFSTFWGSAKLDRPLHLAKPSDNFKFYDLSLGISPLISNFIHIKYFSYKYTTNQNKLLAIQSEIDSSTIKKNSLFLERDSYISSKEAQIRSQEESIDSLTITNAKSKKKNIKNNEVLQKKTLKLLKYKETKNKDILDKRKNTDIEVQEIEANIKRLISEKDKLSPYVSKLKKLFELKSNVLLSSLSEIYSSNTVISELKYDLNKTIASIEEEFQKDLKTLSLEEEGINANDQSSKIDSNSERSSISKTNGSHH
jgi:hypothetical protein